MVLTIIVFIIVLGLLIFVHELGHFLAAKKAGVKVEEFAFGFAPRLWSRKKGETRYSINLIPLGGYVKLYGEEGEHLKDPKSFYSKPLLSRLLVIVAGVIMNFVLAWILFWIGFTIGMPVTSLNPNDIPGATIKSEVVVAETLSNSPAEKSQITKGDIILSANGQTLNNPDDLKNITKANLGKKINFVIKRYGIKKEISAQLSKDKDAPLGVSILEAQKVKVPFWRAPLVAFQELINLVVMIFQVLIGFFAVLFKTGKAEEVGVGPVGIWFIFKTATKLGAMYVLQLTALISVNLGIINILPFPALDGGRLIFWFYELIRKKRITPKVENVVHIIGFVILIALIVLISIRDIMRGG